MGGGLFGTPLYLNPKCLVFSAFVLGVYWLPRAKEYSHNVRSSVLSLLLRIISLVVLESGLQNTN